MKSWSRRRHTKYLPGPVRAVVAVLLFQERGSESVWAVGGGKGS